MRNWNPFLSSQHYTSLGKSEDIKINTCKKVRVIKYAPGEPESPEEWLPGPWWLRPEPVPSLWSSKLSRSLLCSHYWKSTILSFYVRPLNEIWNVISTFCFSKRDSSSSSRYKEFIELLILLRDYESREHPGGNKFKIQVDISIFLVYLKINNFKMVTWKVHCRKHLGTGYRCPPKTNQRIRENIRKF